MASSPARLLKLQAAGQFDYPTVLVGTAGLVTVYSGQYVPADPTNQPKIDALCATLLASAAALYAQCVAWFGKPGGPVNLIIADIGGGGTGQGGAYHYGCSWLDGADLYVDAAFDNPQMDEGLFVAELTECFMGESIGWNCGGSGGEALSRLCAELVSGGPSGALGAFSSAPTWDQSGRPDWISTDQGSDQDYPSIGCGLVYLSWMMAQGFSAAQIAQAGEPAGTLESNYETLTGQKGAYAAMTAALTTSNIQITNDDPFGGIAANPQPAPTPQPVPQPPAPTPAPPNPPSPSPSPSPPPSGTPITKAMLKTAFDAAIATLPD